MSKPSRRPGREAIKQQRRERKKAQRQLRQHQKEEGFVVPARPSLSNGICSYQNPEEERAARLDAVSAQVKVYRSMLPVLLKRLSKIPDPRSPRKIRPKLTVLMIYGMLCFAFQMSSRREANREMTRPMFEANLRRLFPDLEELPHHDTLARLLSRIDVAEIEQAHLDMIRQLIRGKKFRGYLIGGCYPVAIDGTQKFMRAECWDQECLERKAGSKKEQDPEPDKQYYVYVLEANLAFQNGMVIPLLSEVLSASEGDSQRNKQDCELKAFQRLARRLKQCFSHLPIMVLLDGLYPNGPVMELCRQHHWDFMIVLQDDSLPSVWEEIKGLKDLQSENRLPYKWGDRRQHFWWVNDIEYRYGRNDSRQQILHGVVCEESWEELAEGSTQRVTKTSRHAWISSEPLNRRTVHERCNLGARHRWGIENNFLVEKHHGYQYEHCFSTDWKALRGYHYLMQLGHLINVLAQHTAVLAKIVRQFGVRGLLQLLGETVAGPWLKLDRLGQVLRLPYQLRLD